MHEATRCLYLAFVACAGATLAQTSPQPVATPANASVTAAAVAAPISPSASAPFSNFVPTLTRTPTATVIVIINPKAAAPSLAAPSTSNTATTATVAKKPANTGEIFRWVDKNGKVQYSADVPEDRRATARKVDTRSNIVSSRIPASIQGAPQPIPDRGAAPDAGAANARQPITARDKCEAAWQAYRSAELCFAQYRQSTAAGAGSRAGSRVSTEAQATCPALTEPAACR